MITGSVCLTVLLLIPSRQVLLPFFNSLIALDVSFIVIGAKTKVLLIKFDLTFLLSVNFAANFSPILVKYSLNVVAFIKFPEKFFVLPQSDRIVEKSSLELLKLAVLLS